MKSVMLLLMLIGVTNINFACIMKHQSKLTFEQTLKKTEDSIKKSGLRIISKIDHQQAAKEIGLTMFPSTVLIFGNPTMGTKLMNDNILWSYELPLKMAIFEDVDGKVWLSTRKLATDIHTSDQQAVIKNINKLLKKLIKQ